MDYFKKLLLVCICVIYSNPALAQEIEIYGLTIGRPLNMSGCKYSDQAKATEVCFILQYRDGEVKKLIPIIKYPNPPKELLSDTVTVYLNKNKLVSIIEAKTRGLSVQEDVYKKLVNKFGAPNRSIITEDGKDEQYKNTVVAGSIFAIWDIGDITISFMGQKAKTKNGEIAIISFD